MNNDPDSMTHLLTEESGHTEQRPRRGWGGLCPARGQMTGEAGDIKAGHRSRHQSQVSMGPSA